MSVNDKAKILLAITKIVEIQHNAKEVHFEIEASVRSFQEELKIPRRMPEFYQMSMEFEQKDNENMKLLDQLRPLINKNLSALHEDYIPNYIAYTSILENMLFNARLIQGYINVIKKDYYSLQAYFSGNDELQIVTQENINAFLNGPRFLSLQSGISDTYKALLIVIREEVQKRNKADVEFDFIAEMQKETMYNKYIRDFTNIYTKYHKQKEKLSHFQIITYNAMRDAYIFQRNKIIKDIYCSVGQNSDPETHARFGEILRQFENDKGLLKPLVQSETLLCPRFNNIYQYFVLYPFNTIATERLSMREVIKNLNLNIEIDTNTPLLTQLQELQSATGLAFIVLNKYPTDVSAIAVYHDIYDPETRKLNKEIAEKISKIKKLEYQLTTVSGFLVKNIAELRSDKDILQNNVDTLIAKRDKGLSNKRADLRKNVGAVELPVPITLEPAPKTQTDVIVFNPVSFTDDPKGYVVLFMTGDDTFEILKDSEGNGIFTFFVDIPESVGLYRALRERYPLNQLTFIQPSRYLNRSLDEFKKLDDTLQNINLGYESFLTVYKRYAGDVESIQRVEDINEHVKDSLNKTNDINVVSSDGLLKMMVFERLFVRYMNALQDTPLNDVLKDISEKYANTARKYVEVTGNEFPYEQAIQEMNDAFLSALKNASVAYVLRFDEMFLQNLGSNYLIQVQKMREVNRSFNIEIYLNKFYSRLHVQLKRLSDFIVSQQLQNNALVKMRRLNPKQADELNRTLEDLKTF